MPGTVFWVGEEEQTKNMKKSNNLLPILFSSFFISEWTFKDPYSEIIKNFLGKYAELVRVLKIKTCSSLKVL